MMRITTMTIFLSVLSYAQRNYTVNGIVKDKDTGEIITGAIIKIKETAEINIQSNEYGFYSFSLPEGSYTMIISDNKHKEIIKEIQLYNTVKMDLNLEKDDKLIEEVFIRRPRNKSVTSTRSAAGAQVLDIESISKLPVLLGERDVVKVLQFLPGVSSQESSMGMSVRGGNPNQNLFLLDEAPVFNNYHLLGLFSIFNSDALRSVTFYKENIPSQYGGRLSSIVDVKMKEGNNQNFGVAGGIGLISSRITVEGPIQKGKSSFILSARRTYADFLINAMNKPQADEGEVQAKRNKLRLYFYDVNAKANYKINDKNTVYLSAYFGQDVLNFDSYKNNWGNKVGTLRWNSIISSKIFSNTSLISSSYSYKVNINNANDLAPLDINPTIRNWILKQDFSHYVSANHSLRYGFQSSYYYFSTPNLPQSVFSQFLRDPRSMWENAIYANDDYKITDKLLVNYGFRLSAVSNGQNNARSTSSEAPSANKTYINIEPRVMFNYEFNKYNKLRLSYNRNTQNIQTLNNDNNTITDINDVWINLRKPQLADQFNLGYTKKIASGYEFNADIYYKKLSNLVDYKDGVQMNVIDHVDDNLLFNGRGRSYGLEILAKKTTGKLTGWISYTLSKSERRIDGINNGEWYNARQDRTHDLSIVASYQLNPRWNFSGAFVYNSGNAATFPTGQYEVDGNTVLQYGKRNASRMPAYNRLDLNVTYEPQTTKRFKSSWSLGVYNIYAKKNPFLISFQLGINNQRNFRAVQTSLFTFLPNLSYNFKF